jgi:LacI family transcriptional regulator
LKIRIKDIALKAGVSAGTVDRALHNRGEVSEKTKARIYSIAKELNYTPDILARTLALKKKHTIALLLPETTPLSLYWEFSKKGIDKALDELSHFAVDVKKFYFDLSKKETFAKCIKKLFAERPDAVLTAPVFQKESEEFIKQCRKINLPFLFIDSNIENGGALSFIGQNAWQSGQVAAHLLSLTVEPGEEILIVSIAKDPDNIHFIKRIEGFKDYFFNKKKQPKVLIHVINIDSENRQNIADVLGPSVKKNTKGIFVPNSKVFRVADHLNENGNNGLRLIGYDLLPRNIKHLKNGTIDFLISQRPEEQGYRGVVSLLNHLVLKKRVEALQYIPIDILTKENIKYYNN